MLFFFFSLQNFIHHKSFNVLKENPDVFLGYNPARAQCIRWVSGQISLRSALNKHRFSCSGPLRCNRAACFCFTKPPGFAGRAQRKALQHQMDPAAPATVGWLGAPFCKCWCWASFSAISTLRWAATTQPTGEHRLLHLQKEKLSPWPQQPLCNGFFPTHAAAGPCGWSLLCGWCGCDWNENRRALSSHGALEMNCFDLRRISPHYF